MPFSILQERLLGRIIADYLTMKMIFLEANLRRRQGRGVSTDSRKAKARTLKSPPVIGKMIEEYFKDAMNRLMSKLIEVDSISEQDWLDHW